MLQSSFRQADDLVDAVFEDRVEQLLLRGEPPVHRSDADVGVMRHIVEGGLQPSHGEQLARSFEHALPVAFGVFAQPSAWFVNHPRSV